MRVFIPKHGEVELLFSWEDGTGVIVEENTLRTVSIKRAKQIESETIEFEEL